MTGPNENVSDGYHTLGELYEHRAALTAVLAGLAARMNDSWRSLRHHPDNEPMHDGYFIVGIQLPTGGITYHYPLTLWGKFSAVPEIEHAPKWDGTTPAQTVTRLFNAADMLASGTPVGVTTVTGRGF